MLVAVQDGQPAGYCTCSVSPDGTGNIGLIAVDSRWRRARLGTALVASALGYFRAEGMRAATVVTQGRNIASQRLYQRCGFATQSIQLWYHRWAPAGQEGPRDMTYRIPFNKPSLTGKELNYVADAVIEGHSAGDGDYTRRCHEFLERALGARGACC